MDKEEFEEVKRRVLEIKEQIDNDPEIQQRIRERAEEYQRKHGTLTAKDLMTTMTI